MAKSFAKKTVLIAPGTKHLRKLISAFVGSCYKPSLLDIHNRPSGKALVKSDRCVCGWKKRYFDMKKLKARILKKYRDLKKSKTKTKTIYLKRIIYR
jgi:hypothetical protein